MITDIFARRYESVTLRPQYFQEDQRFMVQAAAMIKEPLWLGYKTETPSDKVEAALKGVHDVLAFELGVDALSDRWFTNTSLWQGNESRQNHKYTYANICKNFLVKLPPDPLQGDVWVKERLSLVELAFRTRGAAVREANQNLEANIEKAKVQPAFIGRGRIKVPGSPVDAVKAINVGMNLAFDGLVSDLNERLRLAGYALTYHNGFIQRADDEVTSEQVAKPFWALVSGSDWQSVDLQMKEAVDRRDNGDRTAPFHAVCALESAIKIICGLKGWTTGKEKGASDYINNLNSKSNGRFIEPWEGEMLKNMFSEARNPFAHGPGQSPMPILTPAQTDWAIDTALSWTRNLIRRL